MHVREPLKSTARLGARGVGAVGWRGVQRLVPTAATLPPGRMVNLPGGRGATYVSTTGPLDASAPAGPPLLLLHGLGTTALLSWFSAIPALAQRHRIVLFDQRWHGRGPRTGRTFRLDDLADDAVALADLLEIERFVAVGYSLGGTVAQLLWKRNPERVDGLVLASTARNFRGTGRESTFFRMLPPLLLPLAVSGAPHLHKRALATGMLEEFTGGDLADRDFVNWALTELRLTSRKATLAALSAMGRFNSAPWICDVDVPTSVVITAKDHCIPTRRQRKLAACIAGAEVFEVGGGHASCVTHADQFAAGMAAACASVVERLHGAQRSAATG